MTQLQNQGNVTLSHVCVSTQSIQYCISHLSHMDIFSGSDLVQQRAHTSPSHHHPQHPHHHCPLVQVQSIHVQVRVPTDHMEGTVPVFESKIAANARVHARTHATPYRIPSICSIRCRSATCVQTSAQYVPYRNIIVLLLWLGQRLSTDKWPCHMEAPLVCTIHGANLTIHIMPLAPFRPFTIPNENIRRCPGGHATKRGL